MWTRNVTKVSKAKVRRALKRMKAGKAVSPDVIPAKVWKCLREVSVGFLTPTFNKINKKISEEWRRSVLVLIIKIKVDVQSCSNYRGMKLMSHTVKLWERVWKLD